MENSNKSLLTTTESSDNNEPTPKNSQDEFDEDEEETEENNTFVPLAAKDSEWMDVTYHKPKWRVKSVENEEEEEEQEIFSVNPTEESVVDNENLPIYALFPNLRLTYPQPSTFLSTEVSTTDIAKSLVGEKPNFAVMKTSAKLLPSKIMLESIQEMSFDQDETYDDEDEYLEEVQDPYSLTSTSTTIQDTKDTGVDENLEKIFPLEERNQEKGLWYEQTSDSNLVHQTELLKKTIVQTKQKNTEI